MPRRWSASSACGGIFDEDSLREQLAEADAEAQDPDIWSDQNRARQVMSRRSGLQQQVSTAESLHEAHEELEVLLEMAREGEEGAEEELGSAIRRITPLLDRVELTAKMKGEHDGANAFVEIHSGAGGTESQDWAQMLERLYLRWAERRGFDVDLMDEQPGDEAGIKSASRGPMHTGICDLRMGSTCWCASRRLTPNRGATRPSRRHISIRR